jgi:hypothetical protein
VIKYDHLATSPTIINHIVDTMPNEGLPYNELPPEDEVFPRVKKYLRDNPRREYRPPTEEELAKYAEIEKELRETERRERYLSFTTRMRDKAVSLGLDLTPEQEKELEGKGEKPFDLFKRGAREDKYLLGIYLYPPVSNNEQMNYLLDEQPFKVKRFIKLCSYSLYNEEQVPIIMNKLEPENDIETRALFHALRHVYGIFKEKYTEAGLFPSS